MATHPMEQNGVTESNWPSDFKVRLILFWKKKIQDHGIADRLEAALEIDSSKGQRRHLHQCCVQLGSVSRDGDSTVYLDDLLQLLAHTLMTKKKKVFHIFKSNLLWLSPHSNLSQALPRCVFCSCPCLKSQMSHI